MTWAEGDGPMQLVPPAHPWASLAIYLLFAIGAALVLVGLALGVYGRISNGHWPWSRCPQCDLARRRRKRRG